MGSLLLHVFLVQFIFIKAVFALWTYNSTMEVFKNLKLQNPNIRPLINQSDVLKIEMTWVPLLLYDFDEVMGVFTMVSEIEASWEDQLVQWEGSQNVPSIDIDNRDVWTPILAVHNPAIGFVFGERGGGNRLIRKFAFGQSFMKTAGITKTTCIPNMRYFPHDEHTCSVVFFTSHFLSHEVAFSQNSSLDTTEYQSNNKWTMKSININIPKTCGSHHCVQYFVVIQRKSSFILLNIIAPIILLNAINMLVFCLPVISGERISFCVTMFLSLAVFLTIVSQEFPDGNPVPVFMYFLMAKLVCSSLIIGLTILSLQVHHGERASLFVRVLFKLMLSCSSKRLDLFRRHNKVESIKGIKNTIQTKCTQDIFDDALNLAEIERKITEIKLQCAQEKYHMPLETIDEIERTIKEIKLQRAENADDVNPDIMDNRNHLWAAQELDFKTINWRSVGDKFDYFCLVFFFVAVLVEITIWICFTWGYL